MAVDQDHHENFSNLLLLATLSKISLKFIHKPEGWTIEPKLDRTNPAKSATSKSAIQYRSDTDSDLPWTVRKYTSISKQV